MNKDKEASILDTAVKNVFEKKAFIAPAKPGNEDYRSGAAYLKENFNAGLGGAIGAAPGLGMAGYGLNKAYRSEALTMSPKNKKLMLAGGALAALGGLAGTVKSINKSREHHGEGNIGVAEGASRLAGGAAAGILTLPLLGAGGVVTDYMIRDSFADSREQGRKKKK